MYDAEEYRDHRQNPPRGFVFAKARRSFPNHRRGNHGSNTRGCFAQVTQRVHAWCKYCPGSMRLV